MNDNSLNSNRYPVEEDFSFSDILNNRKSDLKYLLKRSKQLLLVAMLAGIAGALLAWLWPVNYTAKITFVVEESKAGGGGGSLVSALAGQFGFDMGNLGVTSGILAGDNVQELLKSNKLVKRTLLTPFYSDTSAYTLADRYSEVYKLKNKWESKYLKTGQELTFPVNGNLTRLQDSLLHDITERIIEKELSINKPDKKLSFFALSIDNKDERLAKLFCERLLAEAADFYIKTKTGRLRNNVSRLQVRADSIEKVLNKRTYSASAANQILLDLNPAYTTANVSSELQERDKLVLSTIYSEVVKNLEVSKTMLIQETPAFQLVDEPELPLKKNRLGYGKSIVGLVVISVFLYSLVLLITRKESIENRAS